MKRNELKKILDNKKVPVSLYSLNGIKDGDCLCIVLNNDKWQLIHNDRGSKNYIGDFNSEDEVCNEFYAILKRNYKWDC